MSAKRIMATIAVATTAALTLTGCIAQKSTTIDGSELTVAVTQPYTSGNPHTAYGASETNANIAYATGTGFNYYNDDSELVRDESFGHYEKVSDDPLAVTYTVSDGVRWSDGTAVDAVDLLLEWAATSTALNDPDGDAASTINPDTGAPLDRADSRVLFDSGATGNTGIELVTEMPQISDDRMSLTLVFDEPSADWETALFGAGSSAKPAHVVGMMSFTDNDALTAKERVYSAISDGDKADLSLIARTWNTVFNFAGMPANESLLVSNGPYVVSNFIANQYLTLRANDNYSGDRQATFQEITVRFIADPLAQAQALLVGAVQIAEPTMNTEVRDALETMDATVIDGTTDSFEHLDLQFAESMNGTFDNPLVREAFLKTVPRQELAAAALADIQPRATLRESFLFAPNDPGYRGVRSSNGSSDFAEVDIARAQELLVEAGVSAPVVCVLYAAGDAMRTTEFEIIQASAASAGFVVNDCSAEDWRSVLGTPGAYDAALFSWQAARPGVGVAPGVFGTDGYANLNYFTDSDVDELLSEAVSPSTNADDQAELLADIDAALWENRYGMPLFQHPTTAAFDQDRVSEVSLSSLAPGIWWNVWEWKP
ncbi:ABC transporter family substrate-binding protein [Salinibacterium sp. PAMC 21357]|uniref:ABC transporter family substrate-binding protein n=1 Tax=Salinibacterium sp. PAMC 21357 TaxID=1112215 RepID=UPI00047517AC|nr:ABC transporter family substrate-binding protein [Salinibacterium sp. PAMC 21357]